MKKSKAPFESNDAMDLKPWKDLAHTVAYAEFLDPMAKELEDCFIDAAVTDQDIGFSGGNGSGKARSDHFYVEVNLSAGEYSVYQKIL